MFKTLNEPKTDHKSESGDVKNSEQLNEGNDDKIDETDPVKATIIYFANTHPGKISFICERESLKLFPSSTFPKVAFVESNASILTTSHRQRMSRKEEKCMKI